MVARKGGRRMRLEGEELFITGPAGLPQVSSHDRNVDITLIVSSRITVGNP